MNESRPKVEDDEDPFGGEKQDPPPYLIAAAAGVGLVAVVVALVMIFGGGGGGDDDHGVARMSWLDEEASGEVVYCSGADVSGTQRRSVADFNTSSVHGGAHATLADNISPTADGQRNEYLKRTKDGACDVLYLDVIHTPEFASRGLLYDLSDYLDKDDAGLAFEPKMLATVTYDRKVWGVPKQLDGGVLYYRRDRVSRPRTWRSLAAAAEPDPGELPRLRLQLDAYEGLTVAFLKIAYAAGADPIVSEDGKTANLDQPGTLKALTLLQSAIRRKALPRSVTDQEEKGSLYVFEVGRASFLRSWPYAESVIQRDAQEAEDEGNTTAPERRQAADNLAVAPLPPWTSDGPRVGILGGHNLVIPRDAKNPRGALHLIKFLTSEEQILKDAKQGSLAPVLTSLWNSEDVRDSPALRAVNAVELIPRPVIPSYWRVSRTIYTSLRRVLNNVQSKETLPGTLRELQAAVQNELDQDD